MRLVPVFLLETNDKCLPKFVKMDTASPRMKTAIILNLETWIVWDDCASELASTSAISFSGTQWMMSRKVCANHSKINAILIVSERGKL